MSFLSYHLLGSFIMLYHLLICVALKKLSATVGYILITLKNAIFFMSSAKEWSNFWNINILFRSLTPTCIFVNWFFPQSRVRVNLIRKGKLGNVSEWRKSIVIFVGGRLDCYARSFSCVNGLNQIEWNFSNVVTAATVSISRFNVHLFLCTTQN